MSNINDLPPELQQRLAAIMANGGVAPQQDAGAAAPSVPQNAPPERAAPRQPSLMDHVIALRQEVAELASHVNACAQVTDAVGNAVGQMYQMFQQQTTVTDQSATYSQTFQKQNLDANSDY